MKSFGTHKFKLNIDHIGNFAVNQRTVFFFFIGLTGDLIFPVNSPLITGEWASEASKTYRGFGGGAPEKILGCAS